MDDTDAAILDAAAQLLAARGDFTMAAIARQAGISRGTVYRRYADRDGLLARLAEVRGVEADVAGPRERALDAVGAVLGEGGLAALSVEAVARRAELGPATIYRHFEGRDGLLAAFVAERSPRRLAAMLDESPGDDIEGDLCRLAEAGMRFAAAQPGLVRLVLEPGGPRFGEAVDGRRTRQALIEYFGRQVEAGRLVGEPQTMAVAFVGAVMALGLTGVPPPEPAARFLAHAFVHGLRPP